MRLVNVYSVPAAAAFLYDLLAERPRENWISHQHMPTMEEHKAFVDSRPFHQWCLIDVGAQHVGAIEVTDLNEIGVAIMRAHQGRGYGTQALRLFLETNEPLPPIPAKRNGRWLANIAVENEKSKLFFGKAGFKPLQETYVL